MAEMEKIVEKKVYEDNHKRNYATKGEALGVGIPALVLGGLAFANQMNRGGFGLFGGNNGVPENVNTVTVNNGDGVSAPTAFQAWEKGCEEALALTNEIWRGKVAGMQNAAAAREVDVQEKFGLYKATRDLYDHTHTRMAEMGFGLYKGQRDLYDTLNERYAQKFADLDKKVAVMEAVQPYRDKLLMEEIGKSFDRSVCYTDKKTCRAIYGVVGLPSTPTVTVLEGANPFGCNCQPQAAAAQP